MKKILLCCLRLIFTLILFSISSSLQAQWVRKADALKPRSELGETIIYNSRLYAFTGFSDTLRHAEPTSEVYDPATDTWKVLASMPSNTAMTHADAILIDNTIWHIGGRVGLNPGPMSSAIWIYNITGNTWSRGPEIRDPATGQPMVIAASGSALLGRVLHVFGGFTPTACNNDQDTYHLTLDVDTWLSNPSQPAKWENKLKPLPIKRNHISAVVSGGKIYAIGGQIGHDCGGGKEVSYCHVYNPSTDTWTQLPSLPAGRSHAEGSTFAIDGKIYMAGGQGSDGNSSKYVTIFDPLGNNGLGTWIEDQSLTLPKIYEGCSAAVIGATFIVSHGSQGTSKFPLKVTYTRPIVRKPVYKLSFPSECLNLNDSSGSSTKGRTWLFTIDSTKNYITSSNADWLVVSKNSSGTASPNAVDIEVTANTVNLAPGNYNAAITAAGTGGGISYTAATLCVNLTVQQKTQPVNYNLLVTSNGSGNITKSPDQSVYADGTSVTLTASPDAGQKFAGWSGDASGLTNSLTIKMDADKTITGTFSPTDIAYNLNITTNGNGTITKSPDQTSYASGTSEILTASPEDGWKFTGWSGDATGAENPLTITMDADKNIAATFTQIATDFALIITTDGNGTVTKNPDQTTYSGGTSVTLTATPLSGYQFVSWSGDAGGTTNPLSITMDKDKQITATFSLAPQYSLNISVSGNGSVTKSPYQTTYSAGASVTLTANPAASKQFTGWSGAVSGTTNPLTIIMSADKTITATFAQVSGLVTNITAATGRSYALGQLNVGAALYTDRSYKATTIPAFLNNAPFIKTPNDDKANKAAAALSFNINQNAAVYVAYDPRAAALPSWLKSWQKVTGQKIGINDPGFNYFQLYTKNYSPGKVSLGGNLASPAKGALSNYIVIVYFQLAQRSQINTVTGIKSYNSKLTNNSNIESVFQKTRNVIPGFKVYPNPAHEDKVFIEAYNFLKQEKVTITILDALGRIIESKKIITDNNGAFRDRLTIKSVKGLYIIKATGASGYSMQKLIIN